MPLWAQFLIAGIVSVGVIVVGKGIVTGLAISRRRSHHLAQQTGVRPPPPEIDQRPPGAW